MVFGNVPKLHGLIALIAGVLAIPAGCSGDDFSGCKASRTCKPSSGGASGSGGTGGNDGGAGADTGGASGSSSSGKGGTSGTDDGGAGTGGAGDDTDPPTLVSFSPGDGDIDVERDIEVTATFSEAIDERSVTTTSVVLTGPDGDVAGTLSVDGEVVAFVPERPLYLLGDYTLTIGDAVADLAGNTLGEEASVAFKVRDGRWSEPTYPFGNTVPRAVTQFQRNVNGDAVLGMEIWPGYDSVYGAVYSSQSKEFSPATGIRALAQLQAYTFGVGIDDNRRAVVSWSSTNSTGRGWSRFTPEEDWVNAGVLEGQADVFVSPGGEAVAAWLGSGEWVSRSLDLSDGALGPLQHYVVTGTTIGPYPVVSLERVALLGVRSTTNGDEVALSWRTASGWSAAEQVASAASIGSLAFDSDEFGNILVVWRESDQIWSRIYDRPSEEWSRKMFVSTTTPDAIVLPPDMTAGNAIVAFNVFGAEPATWAAIYQAGVGWLQDSIGELDTTWSGGAVGVSIDPRGQALATWHSDLKHKRYIPGEGWRATDSLEVGVNAYIIYAAGARDGSVLVVSNETDSGGENRAPWAVRFE